MDKGKLDETLVKASADIATAVAHLTPIETLGMLEVIKYGLLKTVYEMENGRHRDSRPD